MSEVDRTMSEYQNRLSPWCIVCCRSGAQTLIIQRFRKRHEAEAHLKVLRQLNPSAVYEIVFDLPEARSTEEQGSNRLLDSGDRCLS